MPSISHALTLIAPGITPKKVYTYHFAPTLPDYWVDQATDFSTVTGSPYEVTDSDFVNLSALLESPVGSALTQFASISGVKFDYKNSDSADIVVSGLNKILNNSAGGNIGAFAALPIGSHPKRSDLFVLQDFASSNIVNFIVAHELGHSLGLLDAETTPLSQNSDNGQYTIMSSKIHPGTARFVTELQLYDIAALQAIYGRNEVTNSGRYYLSRLR